MEQLDSPSPVPDILPASVSRRSSTPRINRPAFNSPQTPPTITSNSVPSLRFPLPVGNRQLARWVSSSSPDIMHPGVFYDDPPPMDASIADLGYEFIGVGSESRAESITSSHLGDDIQSLADTDTGTGTDADTNDVDTDSSDDEEFTMNNTAEPTLVVESSTHEEYETEVDMESMADRSLEHPTELFTADPNHQPQSVSDMGHDDPVLLAAERLERRRCSSRSEIHRAQPVVPDSKPVAKSSTDSSPGSWSAFVQILVRQLQVYFRQGDKQQWNLGLLAVAALVLILMTFPVGRYIESLYASPSMVLSPVASVSSVSSVTALQATDTLVSAPTSTVTCTLSSTANANALQTTSVSKSLTFIPFTKNKAPNPGANLSQPPLCSVEVYNRNAILVKMPRQNKLNWMAKQAIMISVSRGPNDIESQAVNISSVPEGLRIELPYGEAHGLLDVTIVTKQKPCIMEKFHVNFGSHVLVDTFSAGKELMKGFAQTLVDTVNGTTTWVEETCIPALDSVSKQVSDQTASVSDSVVQALRDAGNAALSIPNQLVTQVKQSLANGQVNERVSQAETDLLRHAQDASEDLGLYILKGQLKSYLLWLKVSGKTDEYRRYLAASKAYYQGKMQEVDKAKEFRAKQKQKQKQKRHEGRETMRSFWGAGQGL